jgi:ATP-dependent Clp protease adaptor protein ClpS
MTTSYAGARAAATRGTARPLKARPVPYNGGMPETQTLPKVEETTDSTKQRAPLWKVIFHNDDRTTMEFVVWVLMRFFALDAEQAARVMLEVHQTGQGLAGVYPREVAELKKDQVTSAARTRKFPLTVTIEADE